METIHGGFGGGGDQRGEASLPQCDEDVETYGTWGASLRWRSHGSARHLIYLC